MATKLELNNSVEIIKDRFHYVTLRGMPKNDTQTFYFSLDNDLIYEPFFADFGPLNLGHTYSYCVFLDEKLRDEKHQQKRLYHYSSYDASKRTNAVYLICAYSVLMLNHTPEEAFRPFVGIHPPLLQYRDASVGPSTFGLPILECLRGLVKARSCGFFDMKTFNVNEYHFYERIENGDMNWIVPGKFLAFSGPHATHHNETGIRTLTPEDYIPYFKKHNVATVVRLNKKLYDRRRFTEYSVKHVDLYFIDGSCPSDSIVQRFLEVVENEGNAIAVHCKAGLGRTGTLIGCSLMKHHRFTAYEAIAWLRICRPGSVIGPQQHFLVQMQSLLWRNGDLYRKQLSLSSSDQPTSSQSLTTSNNGADLASPVVGNSTSSVISKTKTSLAKSLLGRSNNASTTNQPTSSFSLSTASIGVSNMPDGADVGTDSSATSSSAYTSSQYSGYSGGGGSVTKERVHTSSKERLKADMRMITATLKSIRTSSSTSSPVSSSPPPSLYTISPPSPATPSSSSSVASAYSPHSPQSSATAYVQSSPYTPQSSSRVASTTSTKTKAPSGLALQQKKIENQQGRRAAFATTSSASTSSSATSSNTLSTTSSNSSIHSSTPLKSSVPPSRSTPSLASRTPVASTTLSFKTSASPTTATTASTPTHHRRTRSSGALPPSPTTPSLTLTTTSSSSSPYTSNTHHDVMTSHHSSSSSTPYTPKMQTHMTSSYVSTPTHGMTSSHMSVGGGGYTSSSSSMLSPSSSALLRSKTPPPRRLDDYSSYGGSGYSSNINSRVAVVGEFDYHQRITPTSRYLKA